MKQAQDLDEQLAAINTQDGVNKTIISAIEAHDTDLRTISKQVSHCVGRHLGCISDILLDT